jgi:hypothetical protein
LGKAYRGNTGATTNTIRNLELQFVMGSVPDFVKAKCKGLSVR